jgi:hypothetical protein
MVQEIEVVGKEKRPAARTWDGRPFPRGLEGDAARGLKDTGVVVLGCDRPERSVSYCNVRLSKLHPVEDVEGLNPEIEQQVLVERNVLED